MYIGIHFKSYGNAGERTKQEQLKWEMGKIKQNN